MRFLAISESSLALSACCSQSRVASLFIFSSNGASSSSRDGAPIYVTGVINSGDILVQQFATGPVDHPARPTRINEQDFLSHDAVQSPRLHSSLQ